MSNSPLRRAEYLYNNCGPEEAMACEPMLLYRNYRDSYPVIDGFFIVENYPGQTGRAGLQRGVPQRTAVLLQVTLAREQPANTDKLMLLKKALRAQFSNWADFARDVQWEMVYFQPDKTNKMSTRQRDTIPQGMEENAAHKNAYEFWATKERQYQRSVCESVSLVCALHPEG
ncbi:hypothetical protein TRVL_04375 [Trypanosoma vivax]|nr:hypothetical protein TRVL_04375 [Trypanosoma vivax]